MSSQLALLIGALGIFWMLIRDTRRRGGLSWGLWLVVLWVTMIGSRSVSTWFSYGGGGGTEAESYDAGNPIERAVYFVFIFAGAWLLRQRQVRLAEVVQKNRWLLVFYGFWMVSVLWADLPLVAFKRWFKDLGNIIMVLIVLTETRPVEAVKAVFVRCACVVVPMSVIFIKYIPDLGRTYHIWSGAMMYTGVATHKNTLGVLMLVTGITLMWDLLDRAGERRSRRWLDLAPEGALFLLNLWVLYTSHSATSRLCFVIGAILLLVLRTEAVHARIQLFTRICVLAAAALLFLDQVFDLRQTVTDLVLRMLNRDPTFTGRTDAWVMFIKEVDNPLIGSGFNSFWSGERMQRIWEEYEIIQAHSGYVEIYLNGGILGVTLLAGVLLVGGVRIKDALYRGSRMAEARFVFWLIAIIHNFSEASFCKLGLLWFVVLLVITEPPRRPRLAERVTTRAGVARRASAGRHPGSGMAEPVATYHAP
jgi:exopolysaccharide production protein ExoQ